MKKALLFIVVALAGTTGVLAQKQAGGEKNLEVQFAPIGGNPIGIGGIRFRSFNSDGTSAIRLSVFLGGGNTKEVTAQEEEAGPDAPELITTNSNFSVSIRPGYEKHFAGTERLSPYIGGEVLFGINRETEEEESWDTNQDGDSDVGTTTTKDGDMTIGLNALAGVDYYIADNLYLGAELGFGFQMTSEADTEITYEGPIDADDIDPIVNGSSMGWGPNVQSTIRLGWLFN